MTCTVNPPLTSAAHSAAERIIGSRRRNWSMPGAAYTDPTLFEAELSAVFHSGWLFLGPTAAVPVGSAQTWTVGGESIIVSRDAAGLHAYANVCAHRGSRLVDSDGVRVQRRIVCPYHSWTYRLDGTLASAPLMGDDFRAENHRLADVAVRDLGGLLFVCLEVDASPPRRAELEREFVVFARAAGPHLQPYQLDVASVGAVETYRVAANWKTITENNRECYHCRTNHPEFLLSNYEYGTAGDTRSNEAYEQALADHVAVWRAEGLAVEATDFVDGHQFRVARLPLRPGWVTESLSGQRVGPLLGSVSERSGSVRIVFMPNAWMHINCDYAMLTRLTPVDTATTDVEITYLVARGARADIDFDVDALTAVWASTSTQDWELSERNQLGQASRGYRPGPLSPITETSVTTFHDWYFQRLAAYVRA